MCYVNIQPVHGIAQLSSDLWHVCGKVLCRMRTIVILPHMDQARLTIRNYFGKLGLETELADLYMALHSHGPQSISELSRSSKVERTRIYRLIDKLLESNLIEMESRSKRGVIKAAPISNLRILINQREEALRNLQDELGLIEQTLARNSLSSPAARVQFYYGPEGVRQMLWNELSTKTEILAYTNRILEEATGKAFMGRWTEEAATRKLQCRQLVDENFRLSRQAGIRSGIAAEQEVISIQRSVLAKEIFEIHHVCRIYDMVTAYYHWEGDDVFGIEIHNRGITDSQRQFFELLWQRTIESKSV